jgi:two-component system sensor histidine kinase/response regulator
MPYMHDDRQAPRRRELRDERECRGVPTPAAQLTADALNQVLDNLVSNAVKFSPAGKKILVAVQPVAGRVECRVQDEGPGFTEQDKARMFRRYGRLSARPTGGEPSTGLGLSIVKKLVQAMGGELTFEDTPGGGATFTFGLPSAAIQHSRP